MGKFLALSFWISFSIFVAFFLADVGEWLISTFPNYKNIFEIVVGVRFIALIVSSLITIFLYSFLWQLLWKMPFIGVFLQKRFFHNLNGEWTAELQSNWPIVNAMKQAATSKDTVFNPLDVDNLPDLANVKFDVKIKQNWFRTDVIFSTNDQTPLLISKTISVELFKGEDGSQSLAWVFEVKNKQGNGSGFSSTDVDEYKGAAMLDINDDGNKMDGTFWQNRSWRRGLNAAGLITLHRKKKRNYR